MSIFTKNPLYEFHVVPDAGEELGEMAAVARRYGYAGMAVIGVGGRKDVEDMPPGFSVYQGVEVEVKNASRVRSLVRRWHGRVDCVFLRGGVESVNRAGVEMQELDVLSSPGRINHVLAKFASENGVALEFDLGALIRTRGWERSELLSVYRNNLRLVRKYRVPVLLTATPRCCYDFRAPREMVALAMLFGMTKEEAVHALSMTPRRILERHSPGFVDRGVRLV